MKSGEQTETAILGGGCFWCLEAIYETVNGIQDVENGYSGGARPNPSYEQVCSGGSGHAEVVKIEFNPAVISYEEILEIFWLTHDPTTLNRQGADVGSQYRSVIFYMNEMQKQIAEKSIQTAGAQFPDPIVTEVSPLKEYFKAEDYHQDYYRKHPDQPYCAVVIKPKLKKFEWKAD